MTKRETKITLRKGMLKLRQPGMAEQGSIWKEQLDRHATDYGGFTWTVTTAERAPS